MGRSSEEGASLAAALGRIPSGLFVLTVRDRDRETGMLASWVQQCSFDPPQVSVAVRQGRQILDWLAEGAGFVVNIVPEGGKEILAHFGKGFEIEEPAFDGLAVRRDGDMPPVLLTAHAYIACTVVGHADAGDHILVIGRVVAGEVMHEGKPTVHIRKDGLRY